MNAELTWPSTASKEKPKAELLDLFRNQPGNYQTEWMRIFISQKIYVIKNLKMNVKYLFTSKLSLALEWSFIHPLCSICYYTYTNTFIYHLSGFVSYQYIQESNLLFFSPEFDISQNKREEETKNEQENKWKRLVKVSRNNWNKKYNRTACIIQ